jgi:ubiquitin carboxyl-terminal hydrolase 25/28
MNEMYKDHRSVAYELKAVFMHSGDATYGHYFVYIRDKEWIEFNDSRVVTIPKENVFKDSGDSTLNAYYLVYVLVE